MMRNKLYDYFDSFIEYLLLIFAPEKHLCLFKRRIKLEFKIDSILVLRERYYKSQKEVTNLQLKLAKLISESVEHQQSCLKSNEIINNQVRQIQQLEHQLKNSITLNSHLEEIRQQWLKYHIQQLNNNSYGAGQFYELYEFRKQSAVKQFLCQYNALLTQQEINTIKQQTDYQENFEPYTEIDEETGQILTVHDIAHKMANGEI